MKKRITVGSLMLLVAASAVPLATYRAGRRAEALAPTPPAVVYVTRTGRHYHRAECRYAARGKPEALATAAARLTPCAYCRPPGATAAEAPAR